MWILPLVLAASAPTLFFADQVPGEPEARLASFASGTVTTLARVNTRPDFTPVGSLSPDGRHLAFSVVPPGLGHPERRGEVLVLDAESGAVTPLATGAVAQERPRFTSDGSRILFTRIRREQMPSLEESRRGELAAVEMEVVSVDLQGRQEQVLLSDVAYGLNLAGTRPGHVVLYRVARDGASIVEVPDTGGAPRLVARLPEGPFARDFSVVGSSLTFATLVDRSSRTYGLESLDLESGKLTRLLLSASDHLSPVAAASRTWLALPDGEGDALWTMGAHQARRPANGGRELPQASTPDAQWVAVRRQEPLTERLLLVGPVSAAEVPVAPYFSVIGVGGSP